MDPSSSSITYWAEVALYIFFWLATAFAASGETALTQLNRIRLQAAIERGATRSEAIRGILGDPRRSLATLIIVNTLGLVGGGSAATLLALAAVESSARYLTAAGLLLLLLLGQFVPKRIALRKPERVALLVARPLDILTTVLRPVVGLFGFIASPLGGERPSEMLAREEELRLLVDVGEEEGLIEEGEREMIEGVFDLGETVAREVMVPRIDMIAVDVTMSLRDALEIIIQRGHSRLPVFDESIDRIVGILYVKDALPYLLKDKPEPPLTDLVRQAYFIPESKPVDDLLSELKRMKVHIAIVVDEYGGTAGLVTIEDLIEEIVGEIQDEYDVEEPLSETINAQETIYDARVDLDDINYELDLDLPTEDSDTLGGLIFSHLGRVPSVGDEVRVDNVRLTVLSMEGRRIGKVQLIIERAEQPAGEEPETASPETDATGAENGDIWGKTPKVSGTA